MTGPAHEAIKQAVVAKYGFATKVTKLIGNLAGAVKGKRVPYGDRGVIVDVPA